MQYVAVVCRACIGVVFLVSAATKLIGPTTFSDFVTSLRRMRVLPTRLVSPAAVVVVVAEAAIPLTLATPLAAPAVAGFGLAAVLLAVFGVAILASIRRGAQRPCRCFGASTVPLGTPHVVRNTLLAAMAVLGMVTSVIGGHATPGGLVVTALAGFVVGALVIVLDDIIGLFRPLPATTRRL